MIVRLWNDDRGTASIETVILLPIIALCWAGIFFFYSGYDGALKAASLARQRAWVTSNDCGSAEPEPKSDAPQPEGWLEAITEVPFLGDLVGSVFGETMLIEETTDFDVSGLLGGGTRRARYRYHIMCNLKPMNLDDILLNAVCDFANIFGLC